MRRTCRLRPSELELQPSGGHAEPVADGGIARSDGTGNRWIQQLGPRRAAGAVFELEAPPQRFEIRFCWCSLYLGPVLAPVAKAWVGELMLQLAVAGEQQQPLAIGIQAPSGIDAFDRNEGGQAVPTAARFRGELAQHPVGLVKQQASRSHQTL